MFQDEYQNKLGIIAAVANTTLLYVTASSDYPRIKNDVIFVTIHVGKNI